MHRSAIGTRFFLNFAPKPICVQADGFAVGIDRKVVGLGKPEFGMTEYRWNVSELAAAYSASAEHVHPYYLEMQDIVLDHLPYESDAPFFLVDAGGGSGRLVERVLDRFSQARALVLDQSESFLELARQRLAPSGNRVHFNHARLQDDWTGQLPRTPDAIVSMSAVHHLDHDEKRAFYQRCYDALAPSGILINADEVRAVGADTYLAQLKTWAAHMQRGIDAGQIPEPMAEAIRKWRNRNIDQFGAPKQSGDDCHETVARQLNMLRASGFAKVEVPWHKEMWAVMLGIKGER